jgi:signal transduction histidine kinase
LEVLIRKPRNQEEYQEKIIFCVSEVNRLNHLVDQLLLLARFENQNKSLKTEKLCLNAVILDSISLYSSIIQSKKIHISTEFFKKYFVDNDPYLLSIIINNLVSNALKYSNENAKLNIVITDENGKMECQIIDSGIGIPSEDLQKIFNQFYRSKAIEYSGIRGSGLGLSIVKRLCALLHIDVKITSKENIGTSVFLSFR